MPADVPQPSSPHPGRDLLQSSGGAAQERAGSLRAAVANAMVGLKKKYYGRGPDGAKAWIRIPAWALSHSQCDA